MKSACRILPCSRGRLRSGKNLASVGKVCKGRTEVLPLQVSAPGQSERRNAIRASLSALQRALNEKTTWSASDPQLRAEVDGRKRWPFTVRSSDEDAMKHTFELLLLWASTACSRSVARPSCMKNRR